MRVLHGSRETIVDKEIDLEGLRQIVDTAKPQNPCTDLSEIRRWGAERWEKGFAVSLFVSKVPRHINEKITETRIKKGKKEE